MSTPPTGEKSAQLYDLLLGSEDLAGYLDEFIAEMSARLTERSGAGSQVQCAVTLARRKKPVTAAVSDESTRVLEEVQTRFDDGPCLAAIREHRPVRIGDVRTDTRWPAYGRVAASETEVRSVLGVPFELGGEARAALNVYADHPYAFDEAAVALIQHDVVLASQALRLALQLTRHPDAVADLGAAMESRTEINLAVGIVMAQNRCTQDEAFQILRSASNHRNLKLRVVAADLVAGVGGGSVSTHFTH